MQAAESPPPLEQPRLPPWEAHPVAACWVVLWPVLAGVLVAWKWLGGPVPGCAFRALTGWPCLTCGMHRGLVLLAQGEWLTAWRLNPLNLLLPGFLSVAWCYSVALVAGWKGPKNPPWHVLTRTPRQRRLLRWAAWMALGLLWLAVLAGPAGR